MRFLAELSPQTLCTFRRELSSLRRTVSRRRMAREALEELSGGSERPMFISMTTSGRPQQRYDHRLRDLVHGTGDVTIATDLGSRTRRPVGGSARRQRSWLAWT